MMLFDDVAILAILMSVPVTGIIGWTLVKITQSIFGVGLPLSKKEARQLLAEAQAMREQNAALQQRVENLETIVTGIDHELLEGFLKLQSLENPQANQRKVERIVQNVYPQARRNPSGNGVNPNAPVDENVRNVVNKILAKVDSFLDDNARR